MKNNTLTTRDTMGYTKTKIHLPPSMMDISSWLINSMQHCQVMSLILRTKKAGTLSNPCFFVIFELYDVIIFINLMLKYPCYNI